MALVLLEGLDRTGKTTLAEALADVLHAPLIHKSAPAQPDGLTEYLAPLAHFDREVESLILDRWHWGEMVWPGVYGRAPLMGPREFAYVERRLACLGAVVVLCTGDLGQVWRRIADEPDEPLAQLEHGRSKFIAAAEVYERLYRNSILPGLRYDFTQWDFTDAVHAVAAFARAHESEAVDVG